MSFYLDAFEWSYVLYCNAMYSNAKFAWGATESKIFFFIISEIECADAVNVTE